MFREPEYKLGEFAHNKDLQSELSTSQFNAFLQAVSNNRINTQSGNPSGQSSTGAYTAPQRLVVAKQNVFVRTSPDASYHGGRGDAWRKIKQRNAEEFAIVGFTPPKGSRAGLGALLLGYPFLTTHTAHLHLPLIGELHLASALFYDIGVFTLVVGSTLLILTALGHQSMRGHRRAVIHDDNKGDA